MSKNWRDDCSPEYLAAYDETANALEYYRDAVNAYRRGEIGDAEYLEARVKRDAANERFDAALKIEENR